uniref:TFCD_C domain-containing protein n=1 Tax=Gongylonema pulchrum TaxID=637853 RepID=A0A183ESN6_9BILA
LICLDDYTVDRRGDVGRVLREETMRTLGIVIPLLRCYYGRNDQRSWLAIDKICAALVMKDLLLLGLKGVPDEEVLRETYLDNGSSVYWRQSSCFQRLALLLRSSHYQLPALSGFVISAGGITESTMRAASDALLSVIAEVADSPQVALQLSFKLMLKLESK